MHSRLSITLQICFGLLLLASCKSSKYIYFPDVVDTKSKPISYQTKKTYQIPSMGLSISNQFPGARLNDVIAKNDSTVEIIISPENTPINNSAYYAFKVWSKVADTVYLSFRYPDGYQHRYRPKIRLKDEWSLLQDNFIQKMDNNVTIKLGVSQDTLVVAAQKIVTSKDTYDWVKRIKENKPYVREYSAGLSIGKRNIPVLDIYHGSPKDKALVVLLTRQHPPEVTGFFAFQEFLKTLLKKDISNDTFFRNYRVLVFPIVNPDGVDEGHWRHNLGGVDLNRDWSRYRQKEIYQVVKYIRAISRKDRCPIVLGLDFHSTYEDIFYTNEERAKTTMPNFISDWFAALERNIDGYRVNEASSNSKRPVSKGWFLYGHNAVGITYEIGDSTPQERIQTIGKVSAEQMVRILNSYKK